MGKKWFSRQSISLQCTDTDDYVDYYQVHAGWLIHGSVGWFASIFSGVTGNPVTHWWVVIRTKKGRYYCAQFTGSQVQLTEWSSWDAANNKGKRTCQGLCGNWPENITVKKSYSPSSKTMGDVCNFMQNQVNSNYNLITNNCQDFGNDFYKAI